MAPVQSGHAPNLRKFLDSLKGQSLDASVESLVSLLKRRQIKGPEPCAIATAHILLQVVAKTKWNDVDHLLDRIQQVGHKLVEAQPQELVIGNIIRRILGLIRDEAAEDRNGDGDGDDAESLPESSAAATNTATTHEPESRSALQSRALSRVPTLSSLSSMAIPQSMFNLLSADPLVDSSPGSSPYGHGSGTSTPMLRVAQPTNLHGLKSEIISGIDEIFDEIQQVDDQIAAVADTQIYPGDFVMVYRPSATVERFLVKAAAKRKFTVLIVGETAATATTTVTATPGGGGQQEAPYAALRKKLKSLKVTAINVTSSGAMAYIGRTNKVILDARAVVANGGVIVDGGAGLVARAAAGYSKAVIVLGGVYRVSPEEPSDFGPLVEWGNPAGHIGFTDGPMVSGVDVGSAETEYMSPDLIDIYITNLGAHSRNHLHSIITDHYKKEDMELYGSY